MHISITYLIEVCKISDFIPKVLHDLSVLFVFFLCEVALAFDHGGSHRQTLKVILIQVAIVVDIWNVNQN